MRFYSIFFCFIDLFLAKRRSVQFFCKQSSKQLYPIITFSLSLYHYLFYNCINEQLFVLQIIIRTKITYQFRVIKYMYIVQMQCRSITQVKTQMQIQIQTQPGRANPSHKESSHCHSRRMGMECEDVGASRTYQRSCHNLKTLF